MAAGSVLVSEGHQIRLAHLFDRSLAVHTSLVEPLAPSDHSGLGGFAAASPLRFLLPNDPGAGKTSMPGLFIKEPIARRDFDRCLVVSPGSLAARFEGRLRDGGHPSRSLGPDSPLGEEVCSTFDQTRLFARRSLIAFRTSFRTPTRASPKRLRIVCAPNLHSVDDLDAILAKLAGRRHRLRARGL
jgi:hypothetical protein